MLALLRIVFGFALFSVFAKAVRLAGPDPQTEGTTDAGYLAVAVAIGILNAIVWAPWVGRLMSDPLTGAFTTGHPGDMTNRGLQFAHKLALRRWRRSALFFAFLEGVRNPDLPGAFVLGLTHSRSGSWLEKVFAREVWRFDNAANCLRAWKVLRDRGIEPKLHLRPEVNLLIQGQTRVVPPPPLPMAVPKAAAPPAPKRNERIQLFQSAVPSAASPSALAGAGQEMPAADPSGPEALGGAQGSLEAGIAEGAEAPASAGVGQTNVGAVVPESASPPPLGFKERLRVLFTGRSGR